MEGGEEGVEWRFVTVVFFAKIALSGVSFIFKA